VGLDEDSAFQQSIDYIDGLVHSNISVGSESEKDIMRDPTRDRLLLRSYSRNCSTQANYSTIREDMRTNDLESLDTDTIASYIKALKNMYVLEESSAWNPNLRSKTAIRSSDTRYFVDPSVATAALGIGPKDLINDLSTAGLIFENLCVRDLRIYADSLDGKVYHYRDKNGLECDAVMHLRNGRYGLIEIKLGGDKLIEEGAQNLLALRNNIDSKKMNEPAFMMVLCGVAPFAYRRSDGVFVVPIGCLRN
jgi:predicted AAA+ superfamily ATPase